MPMAEAAVSHTRRISLSVSARTVIVERAASPRQHRLSGSSSSHSGDILFWHEGVDEVESSESKALPKVV